jgi:glycosyltransferase involved in cell wall biosynthesis
MIFISKKQINIMKHKVLFILHVPPPIHGSSVVGQQIFSSILINKTFSTKYLNINSSSNFNQLGKKNFYKFFTILKIYLKLIIDLIYFKPDLCYFALNSKGIAFYRDLIVVFLLKIFNKKIIYHLHNKGIKGREKNIFYKLFYKFIFNNEKVILLSKKLFLDVKFFVKIDQVSFCPNGIEKINNLNSKVENNKTQLLFFSNLFKFKGVFNLLEICFILMKRNLDFTCNLVGDIGDIDKETFYKKVSELNLSNHVIYHGPKFKNDKNDIFLNADIFIHPTLDDCFPLVILEAMQYGLPIISTFEGGIPDIIDNNQNGLLFDGFDLIGMSNAVENLIKNTNFRSNLGNQARKKFKNELTFDSFEKKLNNILKSQFI